MFKWLVPGILIYLLLDNYAVTLKTVNPVVNELLNLPLQVKLKDLILSKPDKQNQLINLYISQVNTERINANLIK